MGKGYRQGYRNVGDYSSNMYAAVLCAFLCDVLKHNVGPALSLRRERAVAPRGER